MVFSGTSCNGGSRPDADRLGRAAHLKPGTLGRSAGLADGDAGDPEDLAGQKKAKTGIHPVLVRKDLLLLALGDSDPVVLADDGASFLVLLVPEPDHGDLLAVP